MPRRSLITVKKKGPQQIMPVPGIFQCCIKKLKKTHYLNYLFLDEICLDYFVSL